MSLSDHSVLFLSNRVGKGEKMRTPDPRIKLTSTVLDELLPFSEKQARVSSNNCQMDTALLVSGRNGFGLLAYCYTNK